MDVSMNTHKMVNVAWAGVASLQVQAIMFVDFATGSILSVLGVDERENLHGVPHHRSGPPGEVTFRSAETAARREATVVAAAAKRESLTIFGGREQRTWGAGMYKLEGMGS